MFSKLMNDSVLFYFIVFIPFTIILFFDVIGIINDKKALEEEVEEEKKKIDFVEDFTDDDEKE